VEALSALAAALLLLSPAGAIAAPKRLDCNLTILETTAGPKSAVGAKSNVGAESRSITVMFDEEAKALTVYQDGTAQVLNNVTMSQVAMSGYVSGEMSLSIDPSSWSIAFQAYKPESTSTEFGACILSVKPPP
jgi:hypothetical protein